MLDGRFGVVSRRRLKVVLMDREMEEVAMSVRGLIGLSA
jgi:hypothetical protein